MNNSTPVSAMWKSPRSEGDPLSAQASMGRLTGEIHRVADLTDAEHMQMFGLLRTYFVGTTSARFAADLAEKEWVILLRERNTGSVQGFSTLMRMTTSLAGDTVTAFFSGDTVIHRDFWGETILPRLWSQHVFRLAAKQTGQKAYWFLISSGYKTYRFLPVFFREFFPCYRQPTPVKFKVLLDRLGQQKHGDEYDARSGVIRFRTPNPLREGVADITAQRLTDPHVAFFQRINPGHDRGDELACLTAITPDNLTAAGRRMVGPLSWPT